MVKREAKNFKQICPNHKAKFQYPHRRIIHAKAILRGRFQHNEIGLFGQFQPVSASWVTSLARIDFSLFIPVQQMLFLSKKTEKSVKNEIVLRPPNSKARWGGGWGLLPNSAELFLANDFSLKG